jgi:hypothetical protein
MVTTGVAGLITGGKRFVDVAFKMESLTTDGVNDGMAVAPKLGVLCFETANQLEGFAGAVVLEDATEKMIETFGAVGSYEAILNRGQRRQSGMASSLVSRVQGRGEQYR